MTSHCAFLNARRPLFKKNEYGKSGEIQRARGSRTRTLHHMGVNHCGRDIRVSQEVLRGADVDAAFQDNF
jgi:hypothetical protein